MKPDIHPVYPPSRIVCACGNSIESKSTRGSFHVEICSNCHPFFTGKYKLVDTAGRVERFRKKYATGGNTETGASGEGAAGSAGTVAGAGAAAKSRAVAAKAKAKT